MASNPSPGWYPDPQDPQRVRWWSGSDWAPSATPFPSAPPRVVRPAFAALLNPAAILVAFTVLLVALFSAATGGWGGFLIALAVAGLILALVARAVGGISSLGLAGPRARALLLRGSVALFVAGIGLSMLMPPPAPTDFRPVVADAQPTTVSSPVATSSGGPDRPDQVVEITAVTEEEAIPFGSVTVEDPTLAAGTSTVTTPGVEGVLQLTYRVTTTDGRETARLLTSERVLVAPVDQVTTVGTYVAPAAPPAPAPFAPPASSGSGCDPNYAGGCVPIASDVDCAWGSGNGPAYFSGTATVVGSDIYDLDRDGDGIACER